MTAPPPGPELMREVRAECDCTLLAFSTGKDALAAWLRLREVFPAVHPYYLYLVPGLGVRG